MKEQAKLFVVETEYEKEWYGMPEYKNQDLSPKYQIIVSFATKQDLKDFAQLVGQPLTTKTQSIWFPAVEIGRYSNKRFIDES